MPTKVRATITRLFAFAALGLLAAGCTTSSVNDLNGVEPTGSAFTQELFHNYDMLARSFGPTQDSGSLFDLFGTSGSQSGARLLANAFATKALLAAKGVEVAPEPANDAESQGMRGRLMRALAAGKDQFPRDAARAQADFDCWMLNDTVAAQADAAATCRNSLSGSLARLERDLHPATSFVAPPPPAPSDYTVYFDFDSWSLTAEDLRVLEQAINTARLGGQSRITIIGHTDTSGSAQYNQSLSVHRANVVAETLVDMGARREAIQTSGVGENDLAVPTADGVKEAKNRRAVVTLLP